MSQKHSVPQRGSDGAAVHAHRVQEKTRRYTKQMREEMGIEGGDAVIASPADLRR